MSVVGPMLALALLAQADAGAPPPASLSLIAPKKSAPADRQYELRRAKDGSGDLLYEAPGFTAHIARDGAARFVDKRFSLIGPWSALKPSPPPQGQSSLQGLFFDVLARRAPRPSQPRDADPPPGPVPLVPTMTPYRPDPSEACTYPRPCFFEAAVVLVGAAGAADLTDELTRLHGQDPYRYEKARFLEATSKLRGGLAARALAEDVRRARAELPARLEAIACDASRSVRERRATIEALRDEMAGDTPSAREAAETIARFLAERFDGARAVRCPAPAVNP
ncbi:MAG TPA: hypothetical protein VHL80_01485 [Polyangia bacterium]|nr:hypothetical protein [Polyangia bacterium]